MKQVKFGLFAIIAVAAAAAVGSPLGAQQKRASPHETVYTKVGKGLVQITYGRPNAKGRKIFGAKADKALVPWGVAWRAGADEATTLITQNPIEIGDVSVPAGAYTLYLVPQDGDGSKLHISKTLGKWGIPVDTKNDLGAVAAKKEATSAPVDQFTIGLDATTIKMSWENTQFSVPIGPKK